MTKREWLRSQGYQVGERGRLSPALLEALKDYPEQEEVVEDEVVVQYVPKYFIPVQEPVRESRTLYGLTREGSKVAFVLCFRCSQHMMYCTCKNGVKAPSIVISSKEPEVTLV